MLLALSFVLGCVSNVLGQGGDVKPLPLPKTIRVQSAAPRGEVWAIIAALTVALPAAASAAQIQKAEMAGYLLVSSDKVPDAYNAGFSLYAAAWPLLQQYPGHRFQTGLFGTWMHAQYEGKPPANLYSDIEGGLGWWRDTRFPTETPKFIMGGVAVNFKEIANGPAHGRGTWEKPAGSVRRGAVKPLAALPDRWPERQAGHLR